MLRWLVRAPRGRAVPAVSGQVTQALAGLVLQAAAARSLGASGLAVFSLAYGAIVLVTAASSGLVGDSLTVLDRHDRGIRAGLHVATAGVAGFAAVVAVLAGWVSGHLEPWAAALFGAAAAAFLVEDTLRRLLMAGGRFWSLAVVDLSSLVLALGSLLVLASVGSLSLTSFVVALLVGQAGAAVVAWSCCAPEERPRGPWRGPALSQVVGFGAWRAAAAMIRPALLTVLRILVVALAGAATYGPVEAARVYTAPTLIVVTGLGSFLLPYFAGARGGRSTVRLRTADLVAAGLAGGVAVVGVAAALMLPVAGPLLTGGDYAVPLPAVLGWSAYAVASAVLLPYSALAAVHRQQRRVLLLRSTELLSLAVVAGLVGFAGAATWAPLALALGPLLAAAAVRQRVLAPLVAGVAERRPVG